MPLNISTRVMLSDFIRGCKKWLCREGGLQAEGDDDNRFQSQAIHESEATKAVVLMHPVLVLAGVCTIKSRQIYGQA